MFFFFFKQKTAYEMRISDWSSDVCSSDLPERVVRRVAVCGGAGDFLLDRLAGSDADVYLTSDLRHHPAAEFVEKGGPALIDVAHWAAESTWLPVVSARLHEALGDTVEPRVSTVRTDPWTFRI